MRKSLVFLQNSRCAGNIVSQVLNTTLVAEGHEGRAFHLGGEEGRTFDDLVERDQKIQKWLITGHNVFGVHNMLGRSVDYFTNIRSTVGRLRSYAQAWADTEGFEETVKQHWDFDNGVTRRLAGIGELNERAYDFANEVDLGPAQEFRVDEKIFKRACENLERMPCCIIQERFIESLVFFEEMYNFPPVVNLAHARFNKSHRDWEMDASLIEELEALNIYDQKIYQHYNKKLDEQLVQADHTTLNWIEARKIFDAAITETRGPEEALMAIQNLINQTAAEGDLNKVCDFFLVLVSDQCLSIDVRQAIVNNVQGLPPSMGRERVIERFGAPMQISTRWLSA